MISYWHLLNFHFHISNEFYIFQKRLEGLTEAELVALLEQVEEEKSHQKSGEQVN